MFVRTATVAIFLTFCCNGLVAAPQPERMSYLDNGTIRIGVNLNAGGAITWLSKSGETTNLVNNWDWGRQIQMSHYAGPTPFVPPGAQLEPHWKHLGWNPVQAGDHFRNPSRIIEHTNDGRTIYVKCIPMQYALNRIPAECTFECWIALKGSTAEVRCRMVNDRPDKIQYQAKNQELPAVYSIGTLYRLMTYSGDKPFTGGPLTRIEKSEEEKKKGGWPWVKYLATERWAALVNDKDWGVGLFTPEFLDYAGGFAGKPNQGGTYDGPTGYIAPMQPEIIDHNIEFQYRYVLVVGSLEQIRKYACDNAARPAPPVWRFASDRQHWTYVNATDTGWPIKGELNVRLEKPHPQLISPPSFWAAADAPVLRIEAAFKTRAGRATLYWKRFDEPKFNQARSASLEIAGDGEYRTYEMDLSASAEYRGVITGLRLDPPAQPGAGDWVRIKSITFAKKP